MRGAEVGPLAEVGLAQDHRAGRAQTLRDGGILGRRGSFERQRSGGGGHAVGRIDVVFDKDGDAVQRPSRAPGFPFPIERIGDGERVGIEFQHGAQRGPLAINGGDARQVSFRNRPGGEALQAGDGDFIQVEARRRGCACHVEHRRRGWNEANTKELAPLHKRLG